MKIDIPYYIKQVLREQRKVYLPEIGTFILTQSSAQISDDKSRILPPTLDIEFIDGGSDDQSLKRYIQDTSKYSDKKIDASISKYTQYTFDNLINNNVNEIKGLGALRRKAQSDRVTFEPTIDLLTREYKSLPVLPIHPIDRIKEQSVVDHAVDTNDQVIRTESKYRWLQTILAGVLIAALAILVTILFRKCSETDSMMYNNPNESIEAVGETGMNEEVADTFFDQEKVKSAKDVDERYKEVDKLIGEKSIDKESNTKVKEELKQLVEEPIVKEPVVEESIIEEEIIESKSASKDAVKIDKETKGIKSDPISNNTKVEKVITKPKSKYADIIPESGKCIIILGSFKKATNITKMISLIERNGKKAYTSQYNGKTRVGFKFECRDVELDNYLNDIRKRFKVKAWYLDPTVEIPFE